MSDSKLTAAQLKEELKQVDLETNDIVISGDNGEIGVARFKTVLTKDKISELKSHFKEEFGAEPNVGTVSPTIGKELAKNAMIAIAIASVGSLSM